MTVQKYTRCTMDTRNYEAKLMQFFSLQLTFCQFTELFSEIQFVEYGNKRFYALADPS